MARRENDEAEATVPERLNAVLVGLYVLLHTVFYAALPVLLLPLSLWWGLLLVGFVLLTPFFWALAHESLHGSLFENYSRNKPAGRVLCILFGAPYQVLRFGHLIHHRFARSRFDCMEAYDPGKSSFLAASGEYYFRLCGGLYLAEIAGNLVAFLPRKPLIAVIRFLFRRRDDEGPDIASMAVLAYTDPPKLQAIRIDSAAALAVLAVAFVLYGAAWWMLATALFGRGLVQSMIDNAPHYNTPMDQPEYALNLALPRWAEVAMLNFNCHRVHHGDPALSWACLSDRASQQNQVFERSWLSAVLIQLRGPVKRDLLPAPGPET